MVVSNECGWYVEVPKLTKEEKAALRREVKLALVENKKGNEEECLKERKD